MVEEPERVLGEMIAFARLAIGSERLRFFFTNRRIIIAPLGKRGAGLGFSFLGKIGSGLEDLFKGGREALTKRGLEALGPDEILAANKENFPVSYGDVVSVDVFGGGTVTHITLLTKDDKFELSTSLKRDGVVALLEKVLHDKLTVSQRA